jgi:ketopantoate reductase
MWRVYGFLLRKITMLFIRTYGKIIRSRDLRETSEKAMRTGKETFGGKKCPEREMRIRKLMRYYNQPRQRKRLGFQ